jgi:hypothetical protein
VTAGGGDAFVVKLSGTGAHLWSSAFGDADGQSVRAIDTDASSHVVIAGSFAGSIDFGTGPLTTSAIPDAFVAKLAP